MICFSLVDSMIGHEFFGLPFCIMCLDGAEMIRLYLGLSRVVFPLGFL